MSILLQLFLSFVQIGLFSIGGGYAAMPLIQSEVVANHAWLTMSEFTDLITIAEMTPGPITINSSTFVGIRTAGLPGAIIATAGCILPSCLIVLMLASPQLAIFFEKFPKLKHAITEDVPRWRAALKKHLQEAEVPAQLALEILSYQQNQLLSTAHFTVQLPQILSLLEKLQSPFAAQARQIVAENPRFTPALHTLFLQRWRLSLVVQTTAFNQQLLEEEREQLLSEVQARMTLSGQLEPVLIENENAAGRLWDMSAGQIKRGDYQLIVKYGDFLKAQPELQQLAEQLGRSREARSVPRKDAPMETFRTLVREPSTVPEQVDGLHQSDDILRLLPPELATLGITELEYEFYRRLVEKQLLRM